MTIVLDVLGALADSFGQRQIEALNTIFNDLLAQLQKEENIHLVSEKIGKVRFFILLCIVL